MIEVPLSQVVQMLVSIGEASQIGLLAQQCLASCRGAPKALAATLSQEFTTTECGRTTRVAASEEVKNDIAKIGINKCARESRFDRKKYQADVDV